MRSVGIAAAITGLGVGIGLVAAPAPAQAYSPNPQVTSAYRHTSDCRCYLSDPADDTVFEYDKGGLARKIELYQNGAYVGKVEFHPNDEQLWVYDTSNDGDSFYVFFQYPSGDTHVRGQATPPKTSATVDKRVYDLNIAEGELVTLKVYDNKYFEDELYHTGAES